MEDFRRALYELVREGEPMTVRHAFYRAVATGLVGKTESEYGRVQRQLAQMRRDSWSISRLQDALHADDVDWVRLDTAIDWSCLDRLDTAIPFEWIADNTRWVRKPKTFDSMEAALQNTAATYRRSLWSDAPVYVEIWCESDSIAGVISAVTYEYDVPLQVVRGFSSISYLYGAAQVIAETGKPAYLYYFGDYDKAGTDIDRSVEKDLRDFAGDAEMYFERTAITAEMILEWDLPTKPSTKHRDFPNTVELEALPPERLRNLVADIIEQHVDDSRLQVIEAAEASEREVLESIAESYGTSSTN